MSAICTKRCRSAGASARLSAISAASAASSGAKPAGGRRRGAASGYGGAVRLPKIDQRDAVVIADLACRQREGRAGIAQLSAVKILRAVQVAECYISKLGRVNLG